MGRGDVDQIKGFALVTFEKGKAVAFLNHGARFQLTVAQVGADRIDRLAIHINKVRRGCTATQTFDPD